MKKTLLALFACLLAGIGAAYAAGTPTTGTATACATVTLPAHTIADNSVGVYTIPAASTTNCTTTTYTVPTVTVTTTVSSGTPTARWFSASSYVNTPVAANPTIDPNEATYKTYLNQLQGMWANGDAGMSGQWSSTAYYASSTTPNLTVTLAVPYNGSSTFTLPWDPSWKPSPDGDSHVIVVNPDGSYVESQGFNPAQKTAHSVARGNVASGDAVPTTVDSVAPLPLAAGLIRPSEIAAGTINHEIRVALPSSLSSHTAVLPAWHSDGAVAGAVPDGSHLWLPRSADLSSLTDPYQKMVAAALQTYGAFVSDAGGSNMLGFYVESTADGSSYPFTQLSLPKAITDQLVVLAPGN